MKLPNLLYCFIPAKKRNQLVSKRNVRVIKDFLREREKLRIAKEQDLAHLKQLRKSRSISKDQYHRLKEILFLTHEQTRMDLIKAMTEKSIKIRKSVASSYN
jgi:hypothetical protein